jgi:hypothetical protein
VNIQRLIAFQIRHDDSVMVVEQRRTSVDAVDLPAEVKC